MPVGRLLQTDIRPYRLPPSLGRAVHAVCNLMIALLLGPCPLAGQVPQKLEGMTHHLWGTENGLPSQLILAIAQTPDGYLWLGTRRGLVRFDGFKFTSIGSDVAPVLQEFGVSSLAVAHDGSLWVGSVGGGVTHLIENKAEHYGIEQGLKAMSVRALLVSSDGTLWAGTDRGLYHLSHGFFSPVEDFDKQWITTMSPDGHKGFWVAGMGLSHYEDGHFKRLAPPALSGPIRAVASGSSGSLWLGTDIGLFERDTSGRYHPIPQVTTNVRSLLFDGDGNLWIGTFGSGLLLRRKSGEIVQTLSADEPASKSIHAIARTGTRAFWFGGDEGLIRLSATGMDFVDVPSAAGSDFRSIFVDKDNSVWFSAGNLIRYKNGVLHQGIPPSIRNQNVRAVFRDSSGGLWIGTLSEGAYRLVDGKIQAHYVSAIRSHAITGFMQAPDGSVWLGTDGGLVRWAHGKFNSFERSPEFPYGVGTVRAMARSPGGTIWIVTPAGLYQFQNGFYIRPSISPSFGKLSITTLFADEDGSLWIGTGMGLYHWDRKALERVTLPQMSTGSSKAVVSIVLDAQKRFLIAFPSTIYRISRITLDRLIQSAEAKGDAHDSTAAASDTEIFAVAKETGTEVSSDLPGMGAADSQGGAWFACSQGILHIAQTAVPRQENPPPVVLEAILIDGMPAHQSSRILLSPYVHSIEIQATPILLSAGTGLQFRRRLVGFEDGWTSISPGSTSSYGRLAPGTYTFRVEANWPGSRQSSVAEVQIIQETAFYKQKWFMALSAIVLTLIVWGIFQMRLVQMRSRFRAVADERNRVAREIHDTLLQGCIGTAALLEALEMSYEGISSQEQRRKSLIAYVREQMGETIKEAREAIWNLRNADDQKPLELVLRDVLDRLVSRKGTLTRFERSGNAMSIVPRVQHELVMATREAVLNALGHAEPNRIELNIVWASDSVEVVIRDDGHGFDPSDLSSVEDDHFGLSGMIDRMRKFGGSMQIDSVIGHGTTIHLIMPVEQNTRFTERDL